MQRKQDHFTVQAKKLGYPARSVFKLMEIDKKYGLIKRYNTILDIGATPGSWSLYVINKLNNSGRVVGLDINPIDTCLNKYKNFIFIQDDLFDSSVIERLMIYTPFDLVLSDAAPATSGNNFVDSQKSLQIAERVIELTKKILKVKGNLVLKIFQGGEEKQVLNQMKSLFKQVKAFKPRASRKKSFEIYYLGFCFNG